MPRCYKIEALNDEGYIIATRYAGTNALARETRDELVEKFGVKKKDVTIEKAEIPHQKDELIAFVNELLMETDVGEDAEEDEE